MDPRRLDAGLRKSPRNGEAVSGPSEAPGEGPGGLPGASGCVTTFLLYLGLRAAPPNGVRSSSGLEP